MTLPPPSLRFGNPHLSVAKGGVPSMVAQGRPRRQKMNRHTISTAYGTTIAATLIPPRLPVSSVWVMSNVWTLPGGSEASSSTVSSIG